MDIQEFVEYNFAPIIGLLFQFVILMYGKTFNKREKAVFFVSLGLQILEITSYNIEFYYSSLSYWNVQRIIFSIIGYIVRPALLYPFVYLLRKESGKKWPKWVYIDLIPLILVAVIQQFAYFTDWVFYFSEDNIFHRGPLGFVSMYVTIFYMLEVATQIVLTKVINKKFNAGLIIVILMYVVLAMVFESILNIRSLGINAGVFSIVFFMFSLQTNNLNETSLKLKTLSEIDSLSQISNRYSGERRIDELVKEKVAGCFAVLDIDNFKSINDTYGHAVGDEAIIKFATLLKETFGDDNVIMRLGGDEFAIYMPKCSNNDELISTFLKKLRDVRLSSDSSFRITTSYGTAVYDGEKETTFDELYKIADVKLYEAKKAKGKRAID